jgi:uncharacterized membrane protein
MTTYLVVRTVHIVATGIWLGIAVMSAVFLMPSLRETGPDGGKVMAAMQRRGLISFVPIVATFSIASGLWLYYRYTAGFSPELSRTPPAIAFGVSGLIGIVAYLVGIPIGPSMARARRLMTEAAALPEGTDRTARLEQAERLRNRAMFLARIGALLLLITATIMSVALFV